VGTPALFDESWAVAAYFAIVALNDDVGSVVSNDVKQAGVEAFHLSAFKQLSSLSTILSRDKSVTSF
jgi:hypothetical protein